MQTYFQAVAVDYDGTLTTGPVPDPGVLEAVQEVRAQGRLVILVTGRIFGELRADFPDVERAFDALVLENGAVLVRDGTLRDLAPPVDPMLAAELAHRNVPLRQGRVLLACAARYDTIVHEAINHLELDCQVVRNRHELMVLPQGVSKGSGLAEALGDLGVSRHSTIGIGDAENDHSLLEACELGVAVSNAVDALKRHADLVLDQADGAGVSDLLSGPILAGSQPVPPRRWRVEVGRTDGGTSVHLPASQVNLLVTGDSGSGKSYVAGGLIEQLLPMGYSVLVVDPEGDYRAMAALRGMLVFGGHDELPPPERMRQFLTHRFGSVVLDLSQLSHAERSEYLHRGAPELERLRNETGLPHWIVVDEAHTDLPWEHFGGPFSGQKGFCLVTYRPFDLPQQVYAGLDILLATISPRGTASSELTDFLAVHGRVPAQDVHDRMARGREGDLLVIDAAAADPLVTCTPVPRRTAHVRHWHKYSEGVLPAAAAFYFRAEDQGPVTAIAGNVSEFHAEMRRACDEAVYFHGGRGDFSLWIREVLQDMLLGAAVGTAERQLQRGALTAEGLRRRVLQAVEDRYTG
jgi:hydroxymethylpyrimidine pyrophosphatase-like HAD family hydrolase